MPTRRDAPLPAAEAKPAETETPRPAVVETPPPAAPPLPRRKLDWALHADPTPPAADAPISMPARKDAPARPQAVYATPAAPAARRKLSGVPLLGLFLALVLIGTIYVLWQQGILRIP